MHCDKERLVGYLYDDLSASELQSFETHLASCEPCREELTGLRSTRAQLGQWMPPEPDLAFQIVRRGTAAVVAPRRWWTSPRWSLAAAAVLVLAAAAAIANIEVRYGGDGFTVRTGWAHGGAASQQATNEILPAAATSHAWKADLAAMERRLRNLESAAVTKEPIVPANVAMARSSDAEVLRRVQRILAESEKRQRDELALRIGQLLRDMEATRRADLAHIQQGFAQVQGITDTTLLRQRQMEQNFYRVGVVQQK